MRVRVHTKSGSTYGFDSEAMTWTRLSAHNIVGWDGTQVFDGKLVSWPLIQPGYSIRFEDAERGFITTTPVVLAEITEL